MPSPGLWVTVDPVSADWLGQEVTSLHMVSSVVEQGPKPPLPLELPTPGRPSVCLSPLEQTLNTDTRGAFLGQDLAGSRDDRGGQAGQAAGTGRSDLGASLSPGSSWQTGARPSLRVCSQRPAWHGGTELSDLREAPRPQKRETEQGQQQLWWPPLQLPGHWDPGEGLPEPWRFLGGAWSPAQGCWSSRKEGFRLSLLQIPCPAQSPSTKGAAWPVASLLTMVRHPW